MKKNKYFLTVRACGLSYLVQGILNNFIPLLFLTFRRTYGLTLDRISFLIMVNFGVQMLVDYLSAKLVDIAGYRKSAVTGQLLSALGLLGLAFLPVVMKNAYLGIIISVFVYAVGSGLIETVGSPIVQACPIEDKDAQMSMLHSHYCWGHVLVVLGSSIFFALFGTDSWRFLSCIWSLFPIVVMFMFMKVPMRSLADDGEIISGRKMSGMRTFWILIVLMFCSGAAEQCISQWISTFAESGLGIEKTTGDLIGTCLFAVFMGSSRVLYGKFSRKINLARFMLFSGSLCAALYVTAAVSPSAAISLAACVLCGTSVGIMWPGIYSISTEVIKGGGTGLFAYLALAGDMGCAGGPAFLGFVSSAFNDNLRAGIFASAVFPILFVVMLAALKINLLERK
ncbi:MAG: MFS transporter [Clostridia bacterium]|nr:MFS transporter [Clostridia bacterium]